MLLLVLCLILVQGTLQLPKNEGVSYHHGGITPTEYQTSFSCVGRAAGYYADVESDCQLYHLCDVDSRRSTHSCPNATLFHQRMMICDHWYMVNCSKSVHDYNANLLIGQRDKHFVGNDHNHEREPVKFFTVSHNPGSLQLPNWFPTTANRPERVPEDNDNTVPSPSQQVSSIHFTYTPPPSSTDVVSSVSSQREANADHDNSGQSIPQTSKSRFEDQRVITPVAHISQYRETGSTSSEREARYRNHDNSGQPISHTTPPRSEDQRVTTPVLHISQYHETGSTSSQREARYRDLSIDHDNSGQSTLQTSKSRFEDQRVITPVPHISQYRETGSTSPQKEATYKNFHINHDNSGRSTAQTSKSRSEDQIVITPVPHISQYRETGSTPSQREATYKNFHTDRDNSGRSTAQTSKSRSEDQRIITPVPHISQYREKGSALSQRKARYRNHDNSEESISQTSTSRSEDQSIITPVPHIPQYHETKSEYSQREARNRNFNTDHVNTGQSIPRVYTSGFEDRRVVTNRPTPVPISSQFHELLSEKKLPNAYTNNPFFQSLVNTVTSPSVITEQQNNPRQNISKKINQQLPAKLENIANVRVSHFETPSTPRRIKAFSVNVDNRGIENISPNNPFFPSITKSRSQEVAAFTTPYSPGSKFSIGENEDLNNIVELHILDPRQMFYIPESNSHEIGKRNSTVLFISVRTPLHNNSHGFMHFRNDVRSSEGTNPQCPRCHPAFLSPGKCQPCVIIR